MSIDAMVIRPARVLVTGAGGPAAVSFMRAVAGPEVELWAVDVDPCATGLYLVPPERRGLVPRGDDPDFAEHLLRVCREAAVDVLLPTVDTELLPLARRQAELEAAGTTLLSASAVTLELCLDKWTLIQRCQGRTSVPKTVLLDEAFDAEAWTWPAIVKPRHGSGGRGVELVAGPADLERIGVPRDGSNIVQQHLPGIEHSIDVLAYRDGRVAAAVPRSRLKVDSGIAVAGCTSVDPALEAIGRQVAESIGLTTVANVQVKEDADGRPRLLEVNPRFPGSMPLTVAAGVDMPGLVLADALGRPVPGHVPHRALGMVRHWEEVFIDPAELDAVGSLVSVALR
jgi:carbamoyl-phosphate synthase large subunit